MKLIPEIVSDAAFLLRRDEVEDLSTVNRLFATVATRNGGPLRPVKYVWVCNKSTMGIYYVCEDEPSKSLQMHCDSMEEFRARLRHATIGRIEFTSSVMLDEQLLEGLLPVRQAWKNATFNTPYSYKALEVFRRAFTELFLCMELRVNAMDVSAHRSAGIRPLRLPALDKCQDLDLLRYGELGSKFSDSIPCKDLAEWLHAEHEWDRPRRLNLYLGSDLSDAVEIFQILVERFRDADTPHSYSAVLMSSHARNAPTFSCENARTKELLLIRPPVSSSEANAFFVERRKFDVLVDKPAGSLDNLMAFLRRLT